MIRPLPAIGLLVALGALVAQWSRAAEAEVRARASERALQTATSLAQELRTLVGRAHEDRRDADVLEIVRAALDDASLSDSALREIAPEPEVAEQGVRRRSARVALSGVTPAEIGRLLAAIRARSRSWSITGVRIEHRARRGSTFDSTITLASLASEEP